MLETLSSLVQQPWALAPDTLLGATVLAFAAALVGEVVWRVAGWPRLVGYGLVGTALAVAGVGFDGRSPMLRLAIDAAMAVLLFEAGARVNLRWLRHNPWLLATSVLESALTAALVFLVAQRLGLSNDIAVPLSIILMGSAPAMVLRVVSEVNAAGQVTERLVVLSALNALYAVVALQLMSAGLLLGDPDTWTQAIGPVAFGFVGSIVLAALVGEGITFVARRFDLRQDNAVLLMAGCVMVALVVAKTLHFSTLLVPLLAGIWLRNRSDRPWLWPQHFGSLGALLVLALYVLVNASWSVGSLLPVAGLAAALMATRTVAKAVGVLALARPSGLSTKQAVWLGLGLTPLSTTAWVLGLDHAAQHVAGQAAHASAVAVGAHGATFLPLLLGCVALLELVSPLILLWCLRRAGEVDKAPNLARRAANVQRGAVP